MNNNHRWLLIPFCVLIAAILPGCTENNFFDISGVMKPPRPSGEKTGIQEVIEKQSGKNITWKYPKRGCLRSAILLHDLLGNAGQEAIAFYQENDDPSCMHMVFVHKKGDAWELISNFVNYSLDIDKVYIEDINGDGIMEILVGWRHTSDLPNSMTMYTYDGESVRESFIANQYNDFILSDLDNDGMAEIVLFSYENDQKTCYAQMIKAGTDFSRAADIVDIGNDIKGIKKLTAGRIDEFVSGIFIDAQKKDNIISTYILYWDKTKNELKVFSSSKESQSSGRSIPIFCRDIDGDSKVEVPSVSTLKGYSNSDTYTKGFYIIKWMSFNTVNENFNVIQKRLYSYQIDYSFLIPESWDEHFTVRLDNNQNTQIFSQWDEDTGTPGETILEIHKFSFNEWKQLPSSEKFDIIGEYNGNIYTAYIPDGMSRFSINAEQLKNSFTLPA